MKRVLLGMSGGVDSTAAVIRLQNLGYEVVGITLLMLIKKGLHQIHVYYVIEYVSFIICLKTWKNTTVTLSQQVTMPN